MSMRKNENRQLDNDQHAKVGENTSPTLLRFLRRRWLGVWRGNPPGPFLLTLGILVGLLMSVPIIYVIWRSLFAGTDRWMRLLDGRIPQLLWNTLSLTFAVTLCAVILGVSLAWLVVRTDVPGRKLLQWMLALPLVIPPYVGAVTYIIVFGPSGWMRDLWRETPWLVNIFGDYPLSIYSFWGVFFVLTMFTYPYVFLIASASLRKMNRNFEEVARSQGMNTRQVFWKVNLPFLRGYRSRGYPDRLVCSLRFRSHCYAQIRNIYSGHLLSAGKL